MNISKLGRVITFRLLAIAFVLYNLAQIVMDYVKGGPDAPSTVLLILAAVIFGGGSVLIGVLTWKEYKRLKAEEEAEKPQSLPPQEDEEAE